MKEKYALVTGASRGIGRSIAIALAKEKYHLYLVCQKSKDEMDSLRVELETEYHINCKTFVGDIGDYDFVEHMFESISELDVLINNAGISHIGLLNDMSIEEWNKLMNTNLTSVFSCCKFASKLMIPKKCGKIVNISSAWGKVGASMEVAYSASKGGVNAFTKALAKELGPSNIQVNAIACGVIDTDMNKVFSEEEREELIQEIPADRMGRTDEVAELVICLVKGNEYLTGQVLGLDGGWI